MEFEMQKLANKHITFLLNKSISDKMQPPLDSAIKNLWWGRLKKSKTFIAKSIN